MPLGSLKDFFLKITPQFHDNILSNELRESKTVEKLRLNHRDKEQQQQKSAFSLSNLEMKFFVITLALIGCIVPTTISTCVTSYGEFYAMVLFSKFNFNFDTKNSFVLFSKLIDKIDILGPKEQIIKVVSMTAEYKIGRPYKVSKFIFLLAN